ncbi:MAG: AMP-binding protein [Opitutales bacterium]
MSAPTTFDRGEADFQARPSLSGHLARAAFVALARRPGRRLVIDRTQERRVAKRGFLLALAWVLSRRMHRWTRRQRVGILFPPGLGAYIANLAVVLAGKVPVNVNFTLGRASVAACFERAEIDCLLSTERMRTKLPDFPWPENGCIDLVEELKALPKAPTLAFLAAVYTLPAGWLAGWLKIPSKGDREEAALLFTSGSSGEPKGVVLSHRNILGNCEQIDTSGLLPENERLIANLPIFHTFGFTVTLWYPLLRGCEVVTLPSPLEVKPVAEAVEAESGTVLIGTPTFFKPYFKRAAPGQLASLKYVIAGAEKTPEGFAERWEQTFGGVYLEGYGLTETSPVVSVNLPPSPQHPEGANRRGTVGRILPGQAVRMLNPDTREPMPVDQIGLLALKGPNVFEGYLNDPDKTTAVMDGDWFVTGDLASLDADGFLRIEGRISRFSKIGGEMVPHATVESALVKALGMEDEELPQLVVTGRPDEAKGEVLVLLAAFDLEPERVREELKAAGFSNLWVPKSVCRVEAIPTLATGKLDLQGIRALAEDVA